ncbi:MAG: hypothetical protein HY855_21395 [Burkholderiales bacterium]|nr:hypothetical protein [Burkholderiales bacterium]
MRFWKLALAAFVSVLLVACAAPVPLQRAQAGALSRDSAPGDVERILGNASVVAQAEFAVDDKPFLARHYRLLTGSRQQMTMVCTPVCIPIFVTVPVTTDYAVIQRLPSKALHAWGTLEELSKDPDAAVSSIMPTVKARLEEAKKKP